MSVTVPIQIVKDPNHKDINFLPTYAHPTDAGMDAKANIPCDLMIAPGECRLIPLGIKVAVPEGYEIQVRPRSGLALKHSVTLANAIGTIDSPYRGEVGAIVINHGKQPFQVKPGDKICQLVLNKFEHITWDCVKELDSTERGEKGYGSSGVSEETK